MARYKKIFTNNDYLIIRKQLPQLTSNCCFCGRPHCLWPPLPPCPHLSASVRPPSPLLRADVLCARPLTYYSGLWTRRGYKRYCRLITFSEFRAHSAPLFRKLQLFTIYNLFRYQASLYMYKHLKGLLPKIWFVFRFNSDIHSHFTRQGHKLCPDFSRTRCRQLSFQIKGPKIWNDLPHELISLPFAQFRKQAKLYILNTF